MKEKRRYVMYNKQYERLVKVRPSKRQMAQQEMGFYAFFHFGMNTFTDREWGDGTEDPKTFRPAPLDGGWEQASYAVDTDQWVQAAASAGMKGVILTCKHHDGFCLWPSAYTSHSIAESPYLEGKGDIVAQTAQSCRKYGLKFGIYLSPWDRHEHTYGSGKAYDDYYVNQLTELLTGYGEIFCVWLDGACGEGPDGRVQSYDWKRYYETVRRLQPDACISVCGPDVRWCGNEAGETREAEWSVVSAALADPELTAGRSQQADNAAFRRRPVNREDQDLGSRERLAGENELIWYPAEVDMSIRPGWFYHSWEDDRVCTLERLKEVYFKSVGGNAMLLLNIPPNTAGRIARPDEKVLRQLGDYLKEAFRKDLSGEARISLITACEQENVNRQIQEQEAVVGLNEEGRYFATAHGATQAHIRLNWPGPVTVKYVVMEEYLPMGQRVESFTICGEDDVLLAQGTVIGQKRIVVLPGEVITSELTVHITDARVSIALRSLRIY